MGRSSVLSEMAKLRQRLFLELPRGSPGQPLLQESVGGAKVSPHEALRAGRQEAAKGLLL